MSTRIALVGFSLEANSLAGTTHLTDGIDVRTMTGGILDYWESRPCVEVLREELGSVDFFEGPLWVFPPGGEISKKDFQEILMQTRDNLASAGPFDGVVVFGHGAGITDDGLDADGPYLALVREIVGVDTPVVCILDFHANVSAEMVAAVDAIVAYRTNPHVDVADCAREAAIILCDLLSGVRTVRAWCQLPMRVPQLSQLTREHEPFGAAVNRAAELLDDGVLNISVLGGFSLADTTDALAAVVVTAISSDEQLAKNVAHDVASTLWNERFRCRLTTTSLHDAVEIVKGNSQRWILSDGSDNPGGGAQGNTVHVLKALVEAGVDGVQSAVHIDAELVNEAWKAGVGAVIRAEFNRGQADEISGEFSTDAEVLSLSRGPFTPTTGVYAGATLSVGRACALRIGGAVVGVGSRKRQCADPDTMRHVGCNPEDARVIVVKSRGHFRAGFEGFVPDDHIIEVGAPGVATNDLGSVTWLNARTDVFPFVSDVEWDGTVRVEGERRG